MRLKKGFSEVKADKAIAEVGKRGACLGVTSRPGAEREVQWQQQSCFWAPSSSPALTEDPRHRAEPQAGLRRK